MLVSNLLPFLETLGSPRRTLKKCVRLCVDLTYKTDRLDFIKLIKKASLSIMLYSLVKGRSQLAERFIYSHHFEHSPML